MTQDKKPEPQWTGHPMRDAQLAIEHGVPMPSPRLAAVDLTPWVQHHDRCRRLNCACKLPGKALCVKCRCTCGLDEALSGGLDTVLQSQEGK